IVLTPLGGGIIQRDGMYSLSVSTYCRDAPVTYMPYFSVVYPAGYLGNSESFTDSVFVDHSKMFQVLGTGRRVMTGGTLFLPAGTIVNAAVEVGAQTRLGSINANTVKYNTYWSIDELN